MIFEDLSFRGSQTFDKPRRPIHRALQKKKKTDYTLAVGERR